MAAMTPPRAFAGRPRERLAWVVLGISAWLALAGLTVAMYVSRTPPSSGFDLELLLVGGRRVAAGLTPYDPLLIGGGTVEIQSLFYSYPPLVAQALSVIAWLPSPAVFLAWSVGAVVAAIAVAALIERRLGQGGQVRLILPVAAVLPFWFPFAIALLFGNLDAWFAALFGVVLIAAVATERDALDPSRRRDLVVGGLALALITITKLHPASLGLWFLVRGVRTRFRRGVARGFWLVLAIAAGAAVLALGGSLLVGGTGPWFDYLAVLRAGMNVDLLDSRNLGPSVQIALAAGLGPDAVRTMQVGVTMLAMLATVVAAWRVRDPVESLAWASVASFVVLPVTWFHYPAALVPFGIAAVVRARDAGAMAWRRTLMFLATAFAIAIAGMGLPLMWLSILALLLAVRASRPAVRDSPAAAASQAVPARA
jgi:Glycosyltransferase family 87